MTSVPAAVVSRAGASVAVSSMSMVAFAMVSAVVILGAPGSIFAQDADRVGEGTAGIYRIPAVRVEEGPAINGVLDDPAWSGAAIIDAFTQQEPFEGRPATERTEVLVGGSPRSPSPW